MDLPKIKYDTEERSTYRISMDGLKAFMHNAYGEGHKDGSVHSWFQTVGDESKAKEHSHLGLSFEKWFDEHMKQDIEWYGIELLEEASISSYSNFLKIRKRHS